MVERLPYREVIVQSGVLVGGYSTVHGPHRVADELTMVANRPGITGGPSLARCTAPAAPSSETNLRRGGWHGQRALLSCRS
jgi:hypothetical protein